MSLLSLQVSSTAGLYDLSLLSLQVSPTKKMTRVAT